MRDLGELEMACNVSVQDSFADHQVQGVVAGHRRWPLGTTASQAQDCFQQGKTQCCAKPPHRCAAGLVSHLRKECCQPFVENSGYFAHSTTCCEYQWSKGGPFDFSGTLFIGAALLLPVSMVGSCQLVRPVGWGAWVAKTLTSKIANSNRPTLKPLALMTNLASSPWMLVLMDNTSPVRGCRGGSTVTTLYLFQ